MILQKNRVVTITVATVQEFNGWIVVYDPFHNVFPYEEWERRWANFSKFE